MNDINSEFLHRITRVYKPGAWIGSVRRAFGPMHDLPEESGDDGVIDTHPPHYLMALWKPLDDDQPFLPRWPAKVSIVAPDARAAVRELLNDVPLTGRLWLTEQPLDWVLIADIVMLCEEGLQGYHFRGLREFIKSENQSTLAAISVNYGGPDEVFEKFVRTRPNVLE